jgi:hypothetical protein
MKKTQRPLPFWSTTITVGAAILTFLIVMVLVSIIFGHTYNANDLRAACANHGGVQQVESTTYDFAIDSAALVVCKDGDVKNIHP